MSNVVESHSDDTPPRSVGKIIARNTLFGLGGQLALRVANFIFTVLVVRTLGETHFGQYSIVLAWAGLFSVIGDLGINQYLAREIARDKKQANALFWDTVVLRLILGLIATIVTVGGALVLTDYGTEIIVGIGLYTATYYFSAIVAPLQSILTGNERLDVLSVMNVISQIIYMVFAGLFLFLGLNFVWLVLAGVISMPIVAWLQYRVIRQNKLGPPVFRINKAMWWSLIRAGMPFAAVQLSLTFAFQVDTIFLAHYTTDAVVGWYGAAYRLTLTFLSLSASFNQAILPTLAQEHAHNPNTVRAWYYTSTRFIIIIALPIAVGGSILSSGITAIYGTEFLPSTIAFAILIWDIPFVMYHSFCGNIATSIRHEGSAARIYMSVGILNVVLNALLVPRFGIIAACFATVITDAFGAALFYTLLRRELGPGLKFRRLFWIGISAAGMALGLFFIRDLNIFIAAAVGGIAYLILVWLLPTFSMDERAQLLNVVNQISNRLRPATIRG
jgi:O-antigen/teichoic acid export membrane protein